MKEFGLESTEEEHDARVRVMAIILAYAHAKATPVGHVLPMVLEIPHDPECDFGVLRWPQRTLLGRERSESLWQGKV